MLNSIEINAFQRIAFLKTDLNGAAVHLFCGHNEAGKSSLGEAVRFALRGLSPRVAKKGAYGELIHNGKKSGHVEIDMDGFPIRRNIRDGKVTTKAVLDYPDLLVDIQLGAEDFARCDTKAVRTMLNALFQVGAQDEFIRARLRKRGVTDDMMNRTLPLIRVSGFDAAAEAAKSEQSRARGEWEGITRERYGSVKAQDWQPAILNEPAVSEEDISALKEAIAETSSYRDQLNQQLGAIGEALRKRQKAEQAGDRELIEAEVQDARSALHEAKRAVEQTQADHKAVIDDMREQIRQLEHDVQAARQATATLECPCCGAALVVRTKEGAAILEKADKAAKPTTDLRTLVQALEQTRKVARDAEADHEQALRKLRQTLTDAQVRLTAAEAKLATCTDAEDARDADPLQAETLAADIATLDQELAGLRSRLQDLEERRSALTRAHLDKKRAADAATLVSQWATIAEALGSGPEGIPAELVAATTKPINTALAKLALPWETSPCVMGADMSVSRADGMPYYLLSESAQWRANAMMQLALATVSPLKLVILDRFDVLDVQSRGSFVDMLIDYTQRHPDITVIALGTLKAKPAEAIDGLRFHWIEDGQLQDAA